MTIALLPQVLALFLFCIGILMVLLRRNTIIVLLGIELMLNSANLSMITFANQLNRIDGQIQAFFIITIAAAESAIGLSILVNLYRNFGSINTEKTTTLNG